jgi:hypothetical protein
MKMGRTMYLIGFVGAVVLAVANARHLTDEPISWTLRYGSIAWALMAVINLLNLIDASAAKRR